jgi:multimeric flavodoxin WrbA
MEKVLIVYHSLSGNTEAMAKAVAEGAKGVSDTQVMMKKAFDVSLEDFLSCDVIAFGSPDYFSYIAGAIKDFFDRTYYPSKGKVTGKPYAAFTTGGGSGKKALSVLEGFGKSFKLKKIAKNISATGKPSESILEECKTLGMELAKAASR